MPRSRNAPSLTTHRLGARVTHACDFLLYRPPEYAMSKRRRWPLLVFLHGRGERGGDLKLLERHGPPRLVAEGRAFPFLLAAPQCPDGEWWNATALDAWLGALIRRHRVDRARIYLTGISMGGFGTWAMAQLRPERYAAIVPVCGGGEVRLADRLRDLPVWAFHGAADEVIPVRRSREMVAAITAAGGDPRLTVYPKTGHDSWTRTYANPALYAWLLAQRRPKAFRS